MSKKPKFDPAIHDENPEWTAEDFAKARPAAEVLPPELLAQFKAKVGRPRMESPKVPVKIRLDGAVVKALRATGPGWQTRINDMLKGEDQPGEDQVRHGRAAQKEAGVTSNKPRRGSGNRPRFLVASTFCCERT